MKDRLWFMRDIVSRYNAIKQKQCSVLGDTASNVCCVVRLFCILGIKYPNSVTAHLHYHRVQKIGASNALPLIDDKVRSLFCALGYLI